MGEFPLDYASPDLPSRAGFGMWGAISLATLPAAALVMCAALRAESPDLLWLTVAVNPITGLSAGIVAWRRAHRTWASIAAGTGALVNGIAILPFTWFVVVLYRGIAGMSC